MQKIWEMLESIIGKFWGIIDSGLMATMPIFYIKAMAINRNQKAIGIIQPIIQIANCITNYIFMASGVNQVMVFLDQFFTIIYKIYQHHL